MAGPQFPDVPLALGVPPVQRDASNPGTGTDTALSGDGITVTGTGPNDWGIYADGGAKALDPDTITSINYNGEYRIADFPIEQGGFESYDKVALPFEMSVVITKGGSRFDRRDFLSAIEDLRSDLKLYNVVTPERTYLNVNVADVRYGRSRENGAGLITVELMLREIRENATATFSKTKDTASTAAVNAGNVQTTTASPVAAATLPDKPSNSGPLGSVASSLSSSAASALQAIPLLTAPAQLLNVQLGQQACQLLTYQKRTGLFMDLAVNNTPILSAMPCLDRVWMMREKYLGFAGDLAFVDLQGKSDPDFSGLASRFQLVWSPG